MNIKCGITVHKRCRKKKSLSSAFDQLLVTWGQIYVLSSRVNWYSFWTQHCHQKILCKQEQLALRPEKLFKIFKLWYGLHLVLLKILFLCRTCACPHPSPPPPPPPPPIIPSSFFFGGGGGGGGGCLLGLALTAMSAMFHQNPFSWLFRQISTLLEKLHSRGQILFSYCSSKVFLKQWVPLANVMNLCRMCVQWKEV